MKRHLDALAARVMAMADHPLGPVVLVALALLEATVFPGPTEAMIIALTLARRERAWWLAALATAASVIGGVIGYRIGASSYESFAVPMLASYGMLQHAETVSRVYRENMMLALVSSGYTPIPYMLYTMLAGAADLPLGQFVTGSFIGRGLKYVPIAALAYLFGPAVHRLLARFGWIVLAGLAVGIMVIVIL